MTNLTIKLNKKSALQGALSMLGLPFFVFAIFVGLILLIPQFSPIDKFEKICYIYYRRCHVTILLNVMRGL